MKKSQLGVPFFYQSSMDSGILGLPHSILGSLNILDFFAGLPNSSGFVRGLPLLRLGLGLHLPEDQDYL